MRPTVKVVTLTSVFAIAGSWGFDRIGVVVAQEEFPPAKSARGDILAKTAQHQFEVFFYPTGVRVLPQPAAGGPVNVSCTAGTATFHHPNSLEPWFSRPLRGTPTSPGQAPESLDLAINLSNAPTTGARVTFVLSGLTNTAEPEATFRRPDSRPFTNPAIVPATRKGDRPQEWRPPHLLGQQ